MRISLSYSVVLHSCVVTALVLSFYSSIVLAENLPVFPGARGFGTTTVAGSGRHLNPAETTVYKVTNLNASGSGSLHECISGIDPRVCVFEVSGTIEISTALQFDSPYITVAGQTAPAPGILIKGGGLIIATHDVLVQHLQVRVGDNPDGPSASTRDGVSVYGWDDAYNVVVDHVSVSWAVDENLSTWFPNTRDITFSNCIASEALHNSIHPKGPHSKGMLIGEQTVNISIHSSLFAHNVERNPYVKPGVHVEFINNIVYNWGGSGGWNLFDISDYVGGGEAAKLNFLGNYYKSGASSPLVAPIFGSPAASGTKVFVQDNIGPTRLSNSGNEWLISSMSEETFRSLTPAFALSGVTATTPDNTLANVVLNAGARPAERNAVDARVIGDVQNGTGDIKDCVSGCERNTGGWPTLATNTRSLSVPNNPNGDDNGNGYTNLEEWLHDFAVAVEAEDSQAPAKPNNVRVTLSEN